MVKQIIEFWKKILKPVEADYSKILKIPPLCFKCDICGAPGEVTNIKTDEFSKNRMVLCKICRIMIDEPESEFKNIRKFTKNKGFKDHRGILNLVYPLYISEIKNGKTTTITKTAIKYYVKFKNPKIAHLAVHAKKYRTRKKNHARFEKIYREELRGIYEQL